MNLVTLTTIFSVLSEIATFLIKYGPGLIKNVETIITDLKLAWQAATSDTPLTPELQAQIDKALDNAHAALQEAVAKKLAQ